MSGERKAIFAGSFDPFTLGHFELINRAIDAGFGEIIVAVASDTGKKTAPLNSRVEIAKMSILGLKGVKVVGFNGLTTDFALENRCRIILRGLRDGKDFEYEKQLLGEYKKLGDVEVFYLISSMPFVSSTAVRNAVLDGKSIEGLVRKEVVDLVKNLYKLKKIPKME